MKTSLKLLIVFVEYAETNALLLIQAVNTVDYNRSKKRIEWERERDREIIVIFLRLSNMV